MPKQAPERMTPAINGAGFWSFKITPNDPRNPGNPTLANRWHAMEFGHREIAETFGHPQFPGIRIVDLYAAPDGSDKLEAAKAHCPSATRFLLSKTVEGMFVVSSRIGYDETRKVDVMPVDERYNPEYADTTYDLHDYAFRETNKPGVLINEHSHRVARLGGDVAIPFAQDEADFAFKAMVAGCREID